VALRLKKGGAANISYQDLHERFGDAKPGLQEMRKAVLSIRAGKFPPLSKYGTAGSFFLNPTVALNEAARLLTQFPGMPQFPIKQGIKISLAWLLDQLGAKGMREGGAFVWRAQPLVIATEGNASARDVRILAERIEKLVFEKTHIAITPEVHIL
jgi:UDP-N-acetylmuramate dehydrogenase